MKTQVHLVLTPSVGTGKVRVLLLFIDPASVAQYYIGSEFCVWVTGSVPDLLPLLISIPNLQIRQSSEHLLVTFLCSLKFS